MITFNSDRLVEALKRKRFFTGKLAETLEVPVDVLHKMIATSEGEDSLVIKLNALLEEAESKEIPKEEALMPVTKEDLEQLVSQKWSSFEESLQNFKKECQTILKDVQEQIFNFRKSLLSEAFCISTPIPKLKQLLEEGKLNLEEILLAENQSPSPRISVLSWAEPDSGEQV